MGTISIGKYTSIGENVRAFMAMDHSIRNISTFPFGHKGMKITKMMKPPIPTRKEYEVWVRLKVDIGNDVWIGSHSVIFQGVNIGNGAVIGAFSTITKDVPPYTVVVGNDRVVKKRFSDEDIEYLLKLKWWDFEDQKVADMGSILCSPNIEALKQYEN